MDCHEKTKGEQRVRDKMIARDFSFLWAYVHWSNQRLSQCAHNLHLHSSTKVYKNDGRGSHANAPLKITSTVLSR